ncbi:MULTISPECIES: ISAs1 family transposase [unclassified Nostoc]|uniref:ISAs1 family transposase n=1 Tax=unclassified Nostoc TaxID=2593658 RepID=UPI002AD3BB73|nr:ISAs1 family transposase [Nostoc sp. ChiQUE02]MDZ8235053.1 ISAs1 family transposase [Nostoc sp. ChiQUE02]
MPKKTVSLIVDSGNDYLIGLKENQPTLYKMAQTESQQDTPLSSATTVENVHSRLVQRECKVFAAPEQLQKKWSGLKTFVVVERQGERNDQPFYERQFYICSQCLEAQQLLADIQGHWGIENRLHWVRDVTFKEDFPPRRGGNAPVNWSILHNFFITIARKLRFRTIPQAQRALSNQLHKVFSFFV